MSNTTMTYPHFGQLLVELREARGVRQVDVATAAQLAVSTVSKQERTETCHLRPQSLSRVIDYLNALNPIPDADLEKLRELGGLPETYRPAQTRPLTADGDPEITVLRARYAGRLRVACDLVHRQIAAEAAADQYLPLLCSAARTLGVAINLPEDPDTGGSTK